MGQSHRVALRYGDHYSITIIDIDDFKPYNDHYGHLQGDDALRKVARALQSGLRRSDRLCRYGGEEFAVLLPQTRLEGAATAADRLRLLVEDLQVEHELGTHQVLTVSCGVAEVGRFGPFPEHWSEIISQADQALYEAKRRGRNRVSVAAEGQADVPDIESD